MTENLPIHEFWPEIKKVVSRCQRSSMYCSIATIGLDGLPNLTPMGTVFLGEEQSCFFFDLYATSLSANLDRDPRLCLMAVDSAKHRWFRSFLVGQFVSPPGVRLYGEAGTRRPANPFEIGQIKARIGPVKWLKGARLLWSDFTHVRDVKLTSFRPVTYPVMMDRHWGQSP